MTTIAQTGSPKYTPTMPKSYEKDTMKDELFDDFSSFWHSSNTATTPKRDFDPSGFEINEMLNIDGNTNISSMFSPTSSKSKSNTVISSQVGSRPLPTSSSSSSIHKTAGGTKYTTYENDEAQKKFGTAKAISSDQFFNNEPSSFERAANLAKFQGSNSISSADYFNEGPIVRGSKSSASNSRSK